MDVMKLRTVGHQKEEPVLPPARKGATPHALST